MEWLVVLVVIVAGYLAWKYRVPLLARVLGQDEARVRRRIEGPRN